MRELVCCCTWFKGEFKEQHIRIIGNAEMNLQIDTKMDYSEGNNQLHFHGMQFIYISMETRNLHFTVSTIHKRQWKALITQ